MKYIATWMGYDKQNYPERKFKAIENKGDVRNSPVDARFFEVKPVYVQAVWDDVGPDPLDSIPRYKLVRVRI